VAVTDEGPRGAALAPRTVPAEATLARLTPHLERMGITRVANITGLDRIGVPVVTACRPNARSLAVSQGKGLSLAAAKVSAIMEAAELFHAEMVRGPLLWARAEELAGERACIDPLRLPRSATAPGHDGPLPWIAGEDLARGGTLLVPFACASADYTLPGEALGPGLLMTTSGLGAGNERDEAIVQGLVELIERDAVTLWRHQGPAYRRASTVDLTTVGDATLQALLERLFGAGLSVRAWDATSDLAVPVFLCLLAGSDQDEADPEFGAGCHPRPAVALLRALLEAAQARLTFIAGSRDDMGADLYDWARRGRRRREALRWLHEPVTARPFPSMPDPGAPSPSVDLRLLLSALEAARLRDVAVVDLTRAEIGIPVVRVVAAGLEGPSDAPDYVPGRRAAALAAT
jgi:ribosomal protein S12 methylthiotransferase accessory factor